MLGIFIGGGSSVGSRAARSSGGKTVEVWHYDVDHKCQIHVATVRTPCYGNDALEYAYRWTQNIEGSWSMKDMEVFENGTKNGDLNRRVSVHRPLHMMNGKVYGLRSTMTGDHMVVRDDNGNGKIHEVDTVGFKCLTHDGVSA